MTTSMPATGVHLVGSVAMADAESVFRTMAGELGPWLSRLPDGETGDRHRWIYWQREMLLDHPAMEVDPEIEPLALHQWDGELIRHTELLRFVEGIDPTTVTFDTGYAQAALESWQTFVRLQADGVIDDGVRFQVSLPTPMASGFMYVSPNALDAYLPVYERALVAALDEILAAVPNDRLSIQWDVCQEVLVYEDYFPWRPHDYRDRILSQLGRLGARVPAEVELGYHLCYGTPKDEHLVMPTDTAILAEIGNGIVAALDRRLDFLHLPVPRDRTDDAYFDPLADLDLPEETELILGLIHHDDAEGDRARISAAAGVVGRFAISTECGWGRADPVRVPGLIGAHRAIMEAGSS